MHRLSSVAFQRERLTSKNHTDDELFPLSPNFTICFTISLCYFGNQKTSQQWEDALGPDLNVFLAHHVSTRPCRVALSPKET